MPSIQLRLMLVRLSAASVLATVLAIPTARACDYVQVAVGGSFTIALDSSGAVWTSGENLNGQIGDGTELDRTAFVPVPGLSGVTKIAAGHGHALALRQDGTVMAWGLNNYWQLGMGSQRQLTTPLQVAGLSPVLDVWAGPFTSFARLSNGSVKAWGLGTSGQLGDGRMQLVAVPAVVRGLLGANVVDIAAGERFTLVLTTDGGVSALGTGGLVPLASLAGVTRLAAGWHHAVAACSDGTTNLLSGSGTSWSVGEIPELHGLAVADLAAGLDNTLVVLADGTVLSWGDNSFGQLGTGERVPSSWTPRPVLGVTHARQAGVGAAHCAVLDRDGRIRTWGLNESGQLGLAIPRPEPRPQSIQPWGCQAQPTLVQVGVGETSTLGLDDLGRVFEWGNGPSGSSPVEIAGLGRVVQLAVGLRHSLALLDDGTVRAWGSNANGALGDGSRVDSAVPVAVVGLGDAVEVAAGFEFSLARRSDGSVVAWGSNSSGQLGDGTLTTRTSPVAVLQVRGATQVAAGTLASLALVADGTVMAWGGPSQIASGPLPRPVPELAGVRHVSTGFQTCLAALSNGEVMGWGDNGYWQLNSTCDPCNPPVRVPGVAGAVQVGQGEGLSYALLADGTIVQWGGQHGPQIFDLPPATILGVSPNASHGVAVLADGGFAGWGSAAAGFRFVDSHSLAQDVPCAGEQPVAHAPEVPGLAVRIVAPGTTRLSWTDDRGASSVTTFLVASGHVDAMWRDRDLSSAECLGSDLTIPELIESTDDGSRWFLVAARSDCRPFWGRSSGAFDVDARSPLASAPPCP